MTATFQTLEELKAERDKCAERVARASKHVGWLEGARAMLQWERDGFKGEMPESPYKPIDELPGS